jgi:hypothetical protein
MSWLHRGSGLSRHDHLFRLAVDESRRDGTAATIVPKLENARQMFDGHSAESVATRLGLSSVSLLYERHLNSFVLELIRVPTTTYGC